MNSKVKKKIVIIGGGLSGLALASELVNENFEVTVLEKNFNLGGRASNTFDRKTGTPVPIGPHVFVTAYNNLKHFLNKIKAGQAISWERKIFLEVVYRKRHFTFKFSNISGPQYILPWIIGYPFMTSRDKVSNLRLAIAITFSRASAFEKLDNINAYDFLLKYGVTENAINKFWRFLTLSLLNVPLELCSAAEFAILMKQWSKLKNKKFGFAKVGLGDVYVDAAEKYINDRGGVILKEALVSKINFNENGVDHLAVHTRGEVKNLKADIFVSTLNPIQLREMLPEEVRFSDFFRNLNAFEPVPYISVNLWFDRKISDKKFWALLNDSDAPQYMNTDFYDQSNIYTTRQENSYITSNIIFSKKYEDMSDAAIVQKTIEEIKEVFPNFNAELVHSHVHRIPYVIYAPFPGMRKHKLTHITPIKNLYLGGDWTSRNLTQCMESAVRSGYECAEDILKKFNIDKKICDEKIQ